MRLAHIGLVGCMLGLPAFVCSRQALSHPEAVPEGGGSGACVIDLRAHPVTRALGGSESARYSTAASECKRLNALIDHSEQLWREGNRKESVRLFYEVYAPSAPSDEIERVQAHLDQGQHNEVAANNNEIHDLVFGSILDHDEPLSADGVFGGERVGQPSWELFSRHGPGADYVGDLSKALEGETLGPYPRGCRVRHLCHGSRCLNGVCLSWTLADSDADTPQRAEDINDVRNAAASAHSTDAGDGRGSVCVSDRPDRCSRHD